MAKNKGKRPWIKDYYSDKVSNRVYNVCKLRPATHELTGGIFALRRFLRIPVFGVITTVPFVETFTDKCSCPVPIKDRCSQELILTIYLN